MSEELAHWRKLYKDFWGEEPPEHFQLPVLKAFGGSSEDIGERIAKLMASLTDACGRIEELEGLGNQAYQIIDFVRDEVAYHFSLDTGLRMNLICEALKKALGIGSPE